MKLVRIRRGIALNCVRPATILFLLAAGTVFAQPASPPAARPTFEVASVKRGKDPISGTRRVENGNFTYDHYLRLLIAWAYGVPLDQVVAPDWTLVARTVIVAKAGRPATEDEVRLMVQTLLEERFKLRVHRETKETSVATLMLAGKNAPQLKESQESQRRPPRYDEAKQQEIYIGYTMNDFVEWLAQFYHGTIDRTGLPGRYDIVLDYRHLADPSNPQETPSSPGVRVKLRFDALEQIGLKLQATKVPLEFVVVDHIEEEPAEN